jgi:predicted ribosomally synthesized peptide with SipW-like signal peptide
VPTVTRVKVVALAALVTLALSAALGGTYAAFTDREGNSGNQLAASAAFPAVLTSVPDVLQTATRAQVLWAEPPVFRGTVTLTGQQWQLCDDAAGTVCANISGATGTSYQMRNDASTKAEYFRVVYSGTSNGQPVTATSRLTQAFTIRGPALTSGTTGDTVVRASQPAITGVAFRVGVPLTVGNGTWSTSGQGTLAYTRQWLRCESAGSTCTAITGATGLTYTPGPADAGRRLRVRVTATQTSNNSVDANAVETFDTSVIAPA